MNKWSSLEILKISAAPEPDFKNIVNSGGGEGDEFNLCVLDHYDSQPFYLS